MLDFAGAGDFDPRPVGVNDLVEICLGGMRDGMPSSVAVAVMLKASPSRIMGGSEQVGICLEQLFRNALEAMPQGGSLRIETECEHSDCARSFHGLSLEPGDYVCVRIRDSGPGMSEDALAHAFQPFFTTKQDRAKRGAGLGLAYVYLVMAAHRGAVELRRPDGGGTEVALHFPAAA
jgi:signal transduction histidine kinase